MSYLRAELPPFIAIDIDKDWGANVNPNVDYNYNISKIYR